MPKLCWMVECLFILKGGTQPTAAERKHGLERTEPDVNLADISNPHDSTAERGCRKGPAIKGGLKLYLTLVQLQDTIIAAVKKANLKYFQSPFNIIAI